MVVAERRQQGLRPPGDERNRKLKRVFTEISLILDNPFDKRFLSELHGRFARASTRIASIGMEEGKDILDITSEREIDLGVSESKFAEVYIRWHNLRDDALKKGYTIETFKTYFEDEIRKKREKKERRLSRRNPQAVLVEVS